MILSLFSGWDKSITCGKIRSFGKQADATTLQAIRAAGTIGFFTVMQAKIQNDSIHVGTIQKQLVAFNRRTFDHNKLF